MNIYEIINRVLWLMIVLCFVFLESMVIGSCLGFISNTLLGSSVSLWSFESFFLGLSLSIIYVILTYDSDVEFEF